MKNHQMVALVNIMETLDTTLNNSKIDFAYKITSALANGHNLLYGAKCLFDATVDYHNAIDDGGREKARIAAMEAIFTVGSGATGFHVMTSYFSFIFDVGAQCLSTGYGLVSEYKKKLQMYEELMNEGIRKKDFAQIESQKGILGQEKGVGDLGKIANALNELSTYCAMIGSNPTNQAPSEDIIKALSLYNETIQLEKSILKSLGDAVGKNYLTISDVLTDDLVAAGEAVGGARVANADPLILDIGGDGYNIEKKKSGAYFDLNCDGFAERINWTREDAILILDKNSNGKVDDGSEVFGDYHLLSDGTRAKNGFEALAQYDVNKDGVIDVKDELFNNLKLWIDADGDGVSSDLYDAIETVAISVSEEVNVLPNVRSFGTVNSLHEVSNLNLKMC